MTPLVLDKPINILIIRMEALGDVIMTTPIIKALKKEYINIDICTNHPVVFANNPHVRKAFRPSEAPPAPQIFSLYDQIINLDFSYEKNPKSHSVDIYALYALGKVLNEQEKRLELFPSDADKEVVDNYLNGYTGSFIVIHMRRKDHHSIEGRNKNLPDSFWINTLNQLNQYNMPIIQIGGGDDFSVPTQNHIFNALNRFSIQQTKYLIDKAKLFICCDTSTLHIAGCTQTPTIALMTICLPDIRAPYDAKIYPIMPHIDCVGCYARTPSPVINLKCSRGDNKCVELFDINDIIQHVERILSTH